LNVAFYFDEHIPRAVALGLRIRGVDVITAQDDGRSGIADALLLDRATELRRPLFSFEAKPVFPPDAPEAIALYEENRRRRAQLTKEEEAALQAKRAMIQNDHGRRRIVWKEAVNNVGVLSLTEKKDCPLMWAHYTAQHTGFVIGLDTAHPAWVESGRMRRRARG
jgi:hypothetical protein